MEFSHIPVLLFEAIDGLNIQKNGIYVDATAGGGGHSQAILDRLENGKLISIDQDPDAILNLQNRFKDNENSIILKGNFGNIKELLNNRGINCIDGILFDIGVSSHQLDTKERGFSFHEDAPLDMRMSQSGISAADLVNTLSQKELSKIIFEYGEEKYANPIARGIVKAREQAQIKTTSELAQIIKENVPQKVRRESHPARKTFQALRILVNRELDVLEKGLQEAFDMLSSGGRIVVITFHSLEDRIVKRTFASWCQGCICPKDLPVCVCHNKEKAKLIVKKPITPSQKELLNNPRARSAKLRICEKL